MPYVLSSIITEELPGMWGEGAPYSKSSIYDIRSSDPKLPPVNYDAHLLKPHSIPHIDVPGHIIPGAETIEAFFSTDKFSCFYGPVSLLKLKANNWQAVSGQAGLYVWRLTKAEIIDELEKAFASSEVPEKLFITVADVPKNEFGLHDPNYVLVLSVEAAEWLVSSQRFNAFGTSWKSSDFEPGSRERPVHKILLRQAVLFECLKMDHVPSGRYFLSAFPLPLAGATESPVVPVLFSSDEIRAFSAS